MNAPSPAVSCKQVVVVDDEPEIGELIAAVVEGLGLACTALTSARDLPTVMGPDVIAVMIDLMMPDVDGIELVRQLAQLGCRAPIVLMSGHDRSVLRSADDMVRTLGLRAAGTLRKPFRVAEVEELLGRVANRPLTARVPTLRQVVPLTEAEVRTAITSDAVVVHYQPQIELTSGRVVGVEALVRLVHPERGLIFPDQFIATAEARGLISPLTDVVLAHALRDVASVVRLGGATVSINVSARSLVDLSLPDRLAEVALRHGIELSRVIAEITESALIEEHAKALDVLARLRLRRAGISVDDFGTGYASMAQLRRIPCTELKIDRSFVNDMLFDDDAMSVVQETIELAHRLKLKVVAEGIETEPQAVALAGIGCDIGQGYLYSRPIGKAELVRWLEHRDGA